MRSDIHHKGARLLAASLLSTKRLASSEIPRTTSDGPGQGAPIAHGKALASAMSDGVTAASQTHLGG